jgi:hypothetical protein
MPATVTVNASIDTAVSEPSRLVAFRCKLITPEKFSGGVIETVPKSAGSMVQTPPDKVP